MLLEAIHNRALVSTHSRAKAAAVPVPITYLALTVSTHSRAKAAAQMSICCATCALFQHTAARRRLQVSHDLVDIFIFCFNTQPREGGC